MRVKVDTQNAYRLLFPDGIPERFSFKGIGEVMVKEITENMLPSKLRGLVEPYKACLVLLNNDPDSELVPGSRLQQTVFVPIADTQKISDLN